MRNRADPTRATTYRNLVLTAICGLLVLLVMRDGGPMSAGEAVAGQEVATLPNAAAQRIQMIQELKELNKTVATKLGTIEKTVDLRLGAIEARMAEQAATMRAEQKQRGKEGNVQ